MKRTNTEKVIYVIFFVVATLAFLMLVGSVLLGVELINNPGSIGEWFGRFIEGFERD